MKLKKLTLLFLIPVYLASLFQHYSDVSVFAALSTRVINTNNLTDSQVHDYYDDFVTEGMTGATLKTALNDRIKNHTAITTYSDTKMAMAVVDRDYTLSPLANGTTYNFANASSDNPFLRLMYGKYNGTLNAVRWTEDHVTIWNKEHTWAKSLGNFGETHPAGTDLHHLIGADQNNNNYHSNLDFGDVISGSFNVLDERGNVSGKTGYSSLSGSQKVYEPADEYKGDIARMIFYMATRYLTYSSTGNPKLRIIEGLAGGVTVTSSASIYGELGILSHYLQWNKDDPVDSYEIKRNNLIYNNFQYNRNPFIDHPEWADIVYDTSYAGSGATLQSQTSSVGTSPAWSNTVNKTLSSISVDASNALTSYAQNEPFVSSGLVVTATMSDTSTKVVTGWTTDYDGLTSFPSSGNKTVTVTYLEGGITKTATYEITVSSKSLIGLSVDTSGTTMTFPYRGNFTSSGLLVMAQYSDTSTRTLLATQYQLSSANLLTIGSQTLTITYAGMTTSYSIQVTFNQASFEIPTTLIISEYIEGSGNNKVIELFNGTFKTVNLSGYVIKLFANGSALATSTLTMSGSIPHGQAYVIYNSAVSGSVLDAINAISASYKTISGVANFNGDDAIGFYLNDQIIDKIGIIGTDPGTAWTGTDLDENSLSTLDKTLIRVPAVYQGNTSFPWTGEFNEWRVYAVDYASNLGTHTMDMEDLSLPTIAYADYFLSITAPYCAALNGGNVPWSSLADEYGYLPGVMKEYFTTTTQGSLDAAKNRYQFLTTKYPSLKSANNFLVNGSNVPLYALRFEPQSFTMQTEILYIFFGATLILIFTIYYKKRKLR